MKALGLKTINGLTALSLLIALGFCTIAAVVLFDIRRAEWKQATDAARNVVSAIESDVARNIHLYDLSLQAVVIGLQTPAFATLDENIQRLVLFDRSSTAEFLGSIRTVDRDGNVTRDSRSMRPGTEYLGDRDFFTAHERNPEIGLFVSTLHVDKYGEYVLDISRRIDGADGDFAGIVVGTLRMEYFRQLFARMKVGPQSGLTLSHQNGLMLMRYPFTQSDIGRDFADTPVFKRLSAAPTTEFEAVAARDAVRRLYVTHRVANLPLFIIAAISTAEIDAGWLRQALWIGSITAALALATIIMTFFLRRQFKLRMRAERRLRLLARVDGLTRLLNRRTFDEALREEWQRAARLRAPLALLMIDADWFKNYNDVHGHQAGDTLLRAIGKTIRSSRRRATDRAGRFGGEEFAVLLPSTDLTGASGVASRIRDRIAALPFNHPASSFGRPTVSIGVASMIPTAETTAETIVALADRALFEAKRNGRNRIEVALSDTTVSTLADVLSAANPKPENTASETRAA